MNINQVNYFVNLNIDKSNTSRPAKNYPNLAPLSKDVVSFGSMKKTQFDGLDRFVIEKYKAPIEKFNSNEDLQNWAKEQTDTITQKDYGGRQEETQIQRKAMLKEWFDYVLKENDGYNNAAKLLILNEITKPLKADNDKLPPVLNRGVLADCMDEIDRNTKTDKKYQYDFNKMYATKLQAMYFGDDEQDTGVHGTKWVIIPSKENDPEHFDENVDKLKTLSYKSWCTKSFNARPYLEKGDFHIYLEDGKPKLGVRFVGDKIEEIQGEKNNTQIPLSYLDVAEKHVGENGLKLNATTQKEFRDAKEIREKIEQIREDISDDIESNNVENILRYFGMECERDDDGLLILDEYKQPDSNFSFDDIGINQANLLKEIKEIRGNADFSNLQTTDLGSLESIGGNADFCYSSINSLKNLKSIGGHADFKNSKINSLGSLQTIGGDADFSNSKIPDLGNLQTIGGHAFFENSQVANLGSLQSVGGNIYFENSQVTKLGNLQTVGGNAEFLDSKVSDIGNLQTIGKNADFRNSQITDIGELQSVGGNAYFGYSQITDLENLQSIGGDAYFRYSQIKDLGNLQYIGGGAAFKHSQITDLKNLQTIGGNAEFSDSKITNLGKLQTILGDADFRNSEITNLGSLQSIWGKAYFGYSQITNLRELQIIGGDADFSGSQITDPGKLQSIVGNAYVHNSQIKDQGKLRSVVKGEIFDKY